MSETPTYSEMEDAVRELDEAPINLSTRRVVNQMRTEILRYREIEKNVERIIDRRPSHGTTAEAIERAAERAIAFKV